MRLPQDVVDLIMDYKYGLEHWEKYQLCLVELFFWHLIHRPQFLNFHAITYWLPL
jgi:hypothetical protein